MSLAQASFVTLLLAFHASCIRDDLFDVLCSAALDSDWIIATL